jgi:hypothetical protein
MERWGFHLLLDREYVGQVGNLRAEWKSAQTARVNNPRAGCHPAPQNTVRSIQSREQFFAESVMR